MGQSIEVGTLDLANPGEKQLISIIHPNLRSLDSCKTPYQCDWNLSSDESGNFLIKKETKDYSKKLDESHVAYHLFSYYLFYQKLLEKSPFEINVKIFQKDQEGAYFMPSNSSRGQAFCNFGNVNSYQQLSSIYAGDLILGDLFGQKTYLESDIIYHEFSHAWHYHLTGLGSDIFAENNFDFSKRNLAEGLADFFSYLLTDNPKIAEAFHKASNTVQWQRDLSKAWLCPKSLTGHMHLDGQMLSRTLFQLKSAGFSAEELSKTIIESLKKEQNIFSFMEEFQRELLKLNKKSIVEKVFNQVKPENCKNKTLVIKDNFTHKGAVTGRGGFLREGEYSAADLHYQLDLKEMQRFEISFKPECDNSLLRLSYRKEKAVYHSKTVNGFKTEQNGIFKPGEKGEFSKGKYFFRFLNGAKESCKYSITFQNLELKLEKPSPEKKEQASNSKDAGFCQLNTKLKYNALFTFWLLCYLTLALKKRLRT